MCRLGKTSDFYGLKGQLEIRRYGEISEIYRCILTKTKNIDEVVLAFEFSYWCTPWPIWVEGAYIIDVTAKCCMG